MLYYGHCIRSGIKLVPVNRGRIPTVNRFFWNSSLKADADLEQIKKFIRDGLCRSLPLGAFSQKKENAVMNYEKIAMLYRLAGCRDLVIYGNKQEKFVQQLYVYLQQLCNSSSDLKISGNAIVTTNPFLAYHLQEVVRTQTIVPVSDLSDVSSGTVIL